MEDESRIASLGLALCPVLERGSLHKLMERLGGPLSVWHADPQEWSRAVKLRPQTLSKLRQWRDSFDYETSLRTLENMGIWYLYQKDELYTHGLLELTHPPLVLFGLGRKELLRSSVCKVSVIGTRRASRYGLESATWIGDTLSQAGCAVVSGLALGVDGAAQKGALQGRGGTIAVLAGGVDMCYPVEHQKLYENITRVGAVVSEYPPGLPVAKHRFLERNRIIAALGTRLVVVQAGEKSGALKTVDMALELGKEVYGVPGPITSVHCRGSNRLLQQGAQILIDPVDLLLDIGITGNSRTQNLQVPYRWQALYDSLMEPINAGELAFLLNLPLANVYAGLLELELAGLIQRGSGGFYQQVRPGLGK